MLLDVEYDHLTKHTPTFCSWSTALLTLRPIATDKNAHCCTGPDAIANLTGNCPGYIYRLAALAVLDM